ncbi:MAG: integration host factor subunit beta [Spirochaetales bacterium]|jgi:integration host factor subunit alpha|nr:integration host factor subunit beta [Spirochaetales bacterium]HNQ97599.1 HU family DNA-binding protein [Treponemataceae bacterium]
MPDKKRTKSDLVDRIYEKSGQDLKDIRAVVDLFLDEVKTALEEGRSVELRGFGTFEIRERKGRQKARNPKTGEIVSVQDHAVVAFRSGKELKNNVWNVPLSADTQKGS